MRCVCKTKGDKKSAERTHQNDAAEEEETVMTTEQMALVRNGSKSMRLKQRMPSGH